MPVIELPTVHKDGTYKATIQGFEMATSKTNGNPMVKVELAVDGVLMDGYIMVDYSGEKFADFFRACKRNDIASEIVRKKNPSFELDDLIGTEILVIISLGWIAGFYRA